jgi:predicted nucleic acid-binding protein
VPALLSWHEHHSLALPIVQAALAAEARAIVPVPALVEAFAVMTRLPAPFRVSAHVARSLLHQTFRARSRVVGLAASDTWTLLDDVTAHQLAGGATYDAHIAACARKAGAASLITFNRRHFERLPLGDVELVVPG